MLQFGRATGRTTRKITGPTFHHGGRGFRWSGRGFWFFCFGRPTLLVASRAQGHQTAFEGERGACSGPGQIQTDSQPTSGYMASPGHQKARDFAVTCCLRPATKPPGPPSSATRNFMGDEVHEKFRDTATGCLANGSPRPNRLRRTHGKVEEVHQDLCHGSLNA